MLTSTKVFFVIFILSITMIIWDYPWPYHPSEGEVLLKVKPTGCTCAELYVLEGMEQLKASSKFPEITRYDEILYQIDVELPVDSSGDLYWLTGNIVGYRPLVEHHPPIKDSGNFDSNHLYPLFKVNKGKWAQFSILGFAGMGLALLNIIGLGVWWLAKKLLNISSHLVI